MPSITDTFDSTTAIGWLGNVYFLALGATFPLFHRLYYAIWRLSNKWGTIFTLLFVSVIFEVGSLLCYTASTDALLLCGRILCGVSAAGVMSGVAFILKGLSPEENAGRKIRDACLLTVYALSRFVGLL
jgi:predicted MFS family arabinose efflux permease